MFTLGIFIRLVTDLWCIMAGDCSDIICDEGRWLDSSNIGLDMFQKVLLLIAYYLPESRLGISCHEAFYFSCSYSC